MSLYNGPARGGTRGGRDQFNWDNVKSDKDRECYLGHSVMAPVGRWQKGKDLLWYARGGKNEEQALQDELRAVKQREENAMLEALGLKPKSQPTQAPMDKKEVDELLRRSKEDREEEGGQGERVQGLGFTPAMKQGVAHREVMAGEGIPQGGGDAGGGGQAACGREGSPSGSPPRDRKRQRSELSSKAERKAEKKAKKAAKKERKAEKKAEKKRRKEGL